MDEALRIGDYAKSLSKNVEFNGLIKCYQCGNCTAICPVSDGSFPRKFVGYLRWGIKEKIEKAEVAWLCLQCKLCDEFCPRGANPSNAMQILKRIAVENGDVPPHIGEFLMNIYRRRNPWGHSRARRGEWIKRLDIEVPTVREKEGFEWLWYVGCANSFDPRVMGVTEKIARILNDCGVNYAVLGREEGCCGNDVKRIGEEGLFELLMEENVKIFKKYGVKKLITHSPHCYNAFKNDYHYDMEVKLFLELLYELIKKGKIELKYKVDRVVTYHDSCFLGRYNNIYELPREILKLIPGVKLVEMPSNRRMSICCGGGSGNITVGYQGKVQPSILRIKEALSVKAEVLAVACPFCKIMLEEGVKSVNGDELEVLDIVDLVYYSAYGEG